MRPASSYKSGEPSSLIFLSGLLKRKPSQGQEVVYDPISTVEGIALLNVSTQIITTTNDNPNNHSY